MQEAGLLDRFVTLGACLLEPSEHRATFINAGHVPPLVYRQATSSLVEAIARDLGGLPLGVTEGIPYDAATVSLETGDVVIVITDGVTDARNKQGVDFQMEGVTAAVNAGPKTPTAIGQRLIAAVKQHSLGCKQHDDITVVCFGRM
jgi:serine phosphatase RsbU (regulator of sigma subunit)